jgi:thiamine-monophosphate kinase
LNISDLTERALIARLRARVPASPDWVLTGIGDDAAVLAPARGMVEVMTADALVEGIHFRREWSSPADIGHKALAVNLSDLAAMGATPRAALLSLTLPATLPLDDFDGLLDGFLALAALTKTPLVGGNLTRSTSGLHIDVTLTGAVRPRRVLRRSGARPGDRLFVTGQLGAAAAGLAALKASEQPGFSPADTVGLKPDGSENALALQDCVNVQRRPSPRLRTGIVVANNRSASACMDLSDGLADAVLQVCEASGCGADVDTAKVPVHAAATLEQALTGGEDYELLFAVPKRRTRLFLAAVKQAGEAPVSEIGICTKGSTITPMGEGFRHF